MSLDAPRSRKGAQKLVQRVAVIGAGIQGIGLSLELATRGMSVDLHEKTNQVHARLSPILRRGECHTASRQQSY